MPQPAAARDDNLLLREIAELKRRLREVETIANAKRATNTVTTDFIVTGGASIQVNGGGAVDVTGTGGVNVSGGGAVNVVGGGGVNVSAGAQVTLSGSGTQLNLNDGGRLATVGGSVEVDAPDTSLVFYAGGLTDGRFRVQLGALDVPMFSMMPPRDTNPATWPATSNAAWTTIALSYNRRYTDTLLYSGQMVADAGVTGQVRVSVAGVVIDTVTVTGTTAVVSNPPAYSYPSTIALLDVFEVRVEAQVTAGTGKVYAETFQLN